ncbi:MAG TPA: hypothetical protein VEZ42_07015 [Pseudonocardia sp.]|nr:hypothetical protein [Pseudonocardia sp.]
MRFEVLASGRLFDLTAQRRIHGARAISRSSQSPPPRNATRPAVSTTPVVPPTTELPAAPAPAAAPPGEPANPPAQRSAATPPGQRLGPAMPVFRAARPEN